MRAVNYNIAYGTGLSGPGYKFWSAARYLRTKGHHLDAIIGFIEETDPDILGLVEVDVGSVRTNYVNQVEKVAERLDHFYQSSTKYGERFVGRSVPFLSKQHNAVLTRKSVSNVDYHFFPVGFKKLIIEVHFEGIDFFLIHLSLTKRIRELQLTYLSSLIDESRPFIVAGDFNTFSGEHELGLFRRRLGLVNPNATGRPTYPSWRPKHQLDFFLCSRRVKVLDFQIADIHHSDHLPLVLDFEV